MLTPDLCAATILATGSGVGCWPPFLPRGFFNPDGFRGSERVFHAGEMARCKAPRLIIPARELINRSAAA